MISATSPPCGPPGLRTSAGFSQTAAKQLCSWIWGLTGVPVCSQAHHLSRIPGSSRSRPTLGQQHRTAAPLLPSVGHNKVMGTRRFRRGETENPPTSPGWQELESEAASCSSCFGKHLMENNLHSNCVYSEGGHKRLDTSSPLKLLRRKPVFQGCLPKGQDLEQQQQVSVGAWTTDMVMAEH